jgi:hypothetical protein
MVFKYTLQKSISNLFSMNVLNNRLINNYLALLIFIILN